jgi:hypothetical protein
MPWSCVVRSCVGSMIKRAPIARIECGTCLTLCLGVHIIVGLDLDVPRSEVACSVFE